jgi:hypothetical protein
MKTLTIIAATAISAMAAPAIAKAPPAAIHTQQVVQPGTMVMAADGSELGRLEGSRTNTAGEAEVVIRGADGQRRAIPTTAVTLNGDELRATWTAAQFRSAPVLVPMAAATAVGSGANQGARPDPQDIQGRVNQPGPEEPVLEDPTRRPEIEQQQAPGENPR